MSRAASSAFTPQCHNHPQQATGHSSASITYNPFPDHHAASAPSMSSDERSPKRQRLSSYSPASTPTETKSTPFVQHPNTPPPSVHMSPSWQSQPLPGLGMAGNGSVGGVNFPTPPSPAGGYQSQSVAQSVGSEGGSARQTPAAEGERHDMQMGEGGAGGGNGDGDVSMVEDDEHRRSDHERTEEGDDTVPPLPSTIGLFYLPSECKFCPHASLIM